MYSTDLLKGTLSTFILHLLSVNGKMYGYQISLKVKELSNNKILVKEGSLYPALHRLREDGYVTTSAETIGKRMRRYYYITEKGLLEKKRRIAEIEDFVITVRKILSN